jgi:ketosteroid isomerase-like protein
MDNLAIAKRIMRPDGGETLADHLADDVVLTLTIPDRPPRAGQLHGKGAVMVHFAGMDELGEFDALAGPLDFLTNPAGDRIAVLGEMKYRMAGSGAEGIGRYALVMDFQDGRITRILDLMDLSAVATPLAGG